VSEETLNAEGALLAAARRGDRDALEVLLEKYQRRVFGFGLRMCGDVEDARDVLQDTMLAATRTMQDFRGVSSLSTWLYTIARSFCIKKRRKSRFAPPAETAFDREVARLPSATPAPDEMVDRQQTKQALLAALGALEPDSREVLILRDVEGLTAPEVAAVTGLSPQAVKSRLHRARLAVREHLTRVMDEHFPAPSPGCPDVLAAYSKKLEGDIDATVCAELEQHISGCAPCERACDSLKRTLALCQAAGSEPVPAAVQTSVRAALRAASVR
jgi:RNA polymerase sigma-70 factor (ECF subfamily)